MTDPIDDLIRDRMRDSYPLDHGSASVLDELRPQMARARSRRRAVHASASATGVAALVIGAIMFAPRLNTSEPSQLELAGPTGSEVASESVDSASTTSEFGRTIEDPTSTAREESTSVAPLTSGSQLPPTSPSESNVPPTTEAASTTVAQTTSTAEGTSTSADSSTTTAQSTSSSTAASATTGATQSSVITTTCGTLRVELVGSGIRLLSTNPNAGISVEVKDSGPETIEVRFTGDDHDCEVHAENRGGQVWTDIENDVEGHDD